MLHHRFRLAYVNKGVYSPAPVALALMVLLAACGTSSAGTPRPPTATASALPTTPTATPVPPSSLSFNSSAAADLNGLHVQTGGVDCGAWLVLDTPQGTYDAGTLQALRTYASPFVRNY